MSQLSLDRGAQKILDKLASKKIRDAQKRWDDTKSEFERDKNSKKLDFKPHHSVPGTFKIRFVGKKNDGYRVFLRKIEGTANYLAFNICPHDDLDK